MKQMAITLIDEAVVAGARRPKACDVLGITYRTLRRWRGAPCLTDGRKGAHRECPHALSQEEKQTIVDVCNQPEYQSLPPSQIVPRLADEGRYIASESSFYRVLKEHDQCHRRSRAQPPRELTRPTALAAAIANQVWSWDITKLLGPQKWTYFHLYVLLDIFSRYVVGWMVATRESAELAQRLVRDACDRERIVDGQLTVHSDRGTAMTSKPLALLYADLGVTRSLSRPHTSNDNPFSEAQFKTVKYRPDFPDRFGSIEDARLKSGVLLDWYNNQHRHSSLALLTPADVHHGRVAQRLAVRDQALAAAFAAHPHRFVHGMPLAQRPPDAVWINPPTGNAYTTVEQPPQPVAAH